MTLAVVLIFSALLPLGGGYLLARLGGNFDPRWYLRH